MTRAPASARLDGATLAEAVAESVEAGGRFAGLHASASDDGSTLLRALVVTGGVPEILGARLAPGVTTYRALTPLVPAAAWYEREIRDLFGVEPSGHPRLDPLVLPVPAGSPHPRPGSSAPPAELAPDTAPLPAHVAGEGLFTIPYGPVRSGVFEAVEYLVESFGEDIPHVRTRVYYKHRGIEGRFSRLPPERGVLVAERVEGVSSVAHALAYCQSLETLSSSPPPPPAALVRVLHAELERVANHLDSVVRHTEAAGQAVAFARMSLHKERLMRLRARLCGHRFGRGVVVPGGVTGRPHLAGREILHELDALESALRGDMDALMETPSFLDRLRRTGVLPREVAAAHGALGPVGRGSDVGNDVRLEQPSGGYELLDPVTVVLEQGGDALARQLVRVREIGDAFRVARQAAGELGRAAAGDDWHRPVALVDGVGVASVESPQGELLYVVEVEDGSIVRVKPRTASFHNLALLPQAFRGDILTDFAFIEASFGLSIAGVAG